MGEKNAGVLNFEYKYSLLFLLGLFGNNTRPIELRKKNVHNILHEWVKKNAVVCLVKIV